MRSKIITRLVLAASALRNIEPRVVSRREAIPSITLEEVAEAKQFFPLEKFFIFGHARSGTTLLARLVRVHPEVHCNWQAHFFTRPPTLQALVADPEVGAWLSRRSNRWNQGKDLSALVLRAVGDFILEREARREGKRIVGDKSPNSLQDGESVRLLHAVYPDARLIYIIRDGRDTAISHRIQGFIDASQHLSKEDLRVRMDYSHNPDAYLRGERSLFTEKGIRQAAEGWVRNVEETDGLGKELFGERYLSVRYENLLDQPWEELKKVWNFLGAPPATLEFKGLLETEFRSNPDADWQQHKAEELVQGVQKGKQGSWREMFTQRDREIFHEVAEETLRAWGYEV